MATGPASALLQHLRRTALLQDGAGLTDAQLLEDYLHRHDEAALAALVYRHGPMVWGVCRRVLRNHHDAEDAFQATFLVLVRKAASIASRELLANWLYGVAFQTARKARATAAKRKERERQVKEMPEPAVAEQDLWRDLQPLLDEELSRLPDKYRAVIVLCDLEGKTRKEAARQLACPEGTVAGWLARARVRLAKRLAQRGVVLSGGALAGLLAQKVASAGVPRSVVSSTIKATSLLAGGQAAAGAISAKVAALTEGVLKTMLLSNFKVATAVLLVVAIGGAGAGGLFYQARAAQPPFAHTDSEPVRLSERAAPKRAGKAVRGADFLESLLQQVEKDAIPFPDDKREQGDPDLGFYPPAKALLGKAKDAHAIRDARRKAYVKLLAIAEIQVSLKKLAASTDDKTDREELAKIERAVRAVRDNKMPSDWVYPLQDLMLKEKPEKK